MDKLIRDKSCDIYDQSEAETESRANYNPNRDTLKDWIRNNELHAIQSKIQSYRNSDPNPTPNESQE
jgi:hypothetical protein